MATRTVESGIPRTYRGSFRLAGHGANALARATTGLGYAVGQSVVAAGGRGVRSAQASWSAASDRRADLKAAGRATVEAATHPNRSVLIGAVAGLAMVGAGIALLKYRAAQAPAPESFEYVSLDDEPEPVD